MSLKRKGFLGELKTIEYFTKLDYPVFAEQANSCRVDLIVLIKNVPILVQTKTTTEVNGVIAVESRKSHLNKKYDYRYSEEDFDIVSLYVENLDILLFMSSREFCSQGCHKFRLEQPKGRCNHVTRLVHDYLSHEDALSNYRPRQVEIS